MPRPSLLHKLVACIALASIPCAGALAVEEPASRGAASAVEEPASSGAVSEELLLGQQLPLWSVLPFLGILLTIALFPLLAPHFWHHQYPRLTALWAAVFALPFLWAFGAPAWHEILHIYTIDYIPFIILLWGLFTASGGLRVSGRFQGTPRQNTVLLLIGTLVASWVGTTGASMLLIRTVLRANAWRRSRAHVVVFFIFLVSNIGGSLTPLGDPPLFLGFIHGVPFFWTFHLLPHMSLVSAVLLVVFYLWDRAAYRWEMAAGRGAPAAEAPAGGGRLVIEGLVNVPLLAGIVGAVLLSGLWQAGQLQVGPVRLEVQNVVRDALIVILGLLSLRLTPADVRRRNEFTWGPIKEVAILFAGIFMTIIPALAILKAGADGSLGFLLAMVNDPAHYFWSTGILSSFLDNAPTYLTFFSSALGKFFEGVPEREAVHLLIEHKNVYLAAIAAGAVFMGANTYIGNAPNFMVKAIAEESGVKMPSFFGYLLRYSVPILIPTFLLVSWIFF